MKKLILIVLVVLLSGTVQAEGKGPPKGICELLERSATGNLIAWVIIDAKILGEDARARNIDTVANTLYIREKLGCAPTSTRDIIDSAVVGKYSSKDQ
jgi:hypothetical protein